MKNKGMVIFVLVLLIAVMIGIMIMVSNGNNKNADKGKGNIAEETKVNIYEGLNRVVVKNSVVYNEQLLDDFIAKQNEKSAYNLRLEIEYNDKIILLELNRHGKLDSKGENGENYWEYTLKEEGKEEKTFSYYMYKLGKRVEDVNGGEVVVSLSYSNEDPELGGITPTDIFRYSSKYSSYTNK